MLERTVVTGEDRFGFWDLEGYAEMVNVMVTGM